jgi:nucleoside 2-deoxyribosyltransferase
MRAPELNEAKGALEARGIEVTSRWLESLRPTGDGADPHWIGKVSREDIERADAYVLLGDERGDSGHRHVEFGIAMGLNKPIFVVAPEAENLWQRLPGVTVVQSWESLPELLLKSVAA